MVLILVGINLFLIGAFASYVYLAASGRMRGPVGHTGLTGRDGRDGEPGKAGEPGRCCATCEDSTTCYVWKPKAQPTYEVIQPSTPDDPLAPITEADLTE